VLSPVAEALRLKGVEKALVVHSEDGLDEISACAPTRGLLVTKNCLEEIEFAPEDFCIKHGHLKDIKAVSLKDNIAVFHKVLKGEKGPERDIVVLNSGAAIFIAGIAGDIQEGIARAFDSIDSGRALQVFDQFRSFSKGEKNGSIFR
jgi:anthranilate phosphoribosyltransferase